MTNWVTIDEVQAAWPDALLDEDDLQRLIDAAQEVLLEYAPALAVDAEVPARYKEALIMHVRELWRASERDGDVIGINGDGFAVRARDLTAQVKALLRPRTGKPALR